ncbi:hypothetical protein HHI36_001130 [Cryptolaemus montrouzieri]|uniref:Uncharacterized protein n=1 Tax=Cryptolaemus montrouzieri TaxID=559131 RepID=A0ABD2P7J4_9CUCU
MVEVHNFDYASHLGKTRFTHVGDNTSEEVFIEYRILVLQQLTFRNFYYFSTPAGAWELVDLKPLHTVLYYHQEGRRKTRAIDHAPFIGTPKAKFLRSLIDKFTENLAALKNLNFPVYEW